MKYWKKNKMNFNRGMGMNTKNFYSYPNQQNRTQ